MNFIRGIDLRMKQEEFKHFLWNQNIHHSLVFSSIGLFIESMAFGYVLKAKLTRYFPFYITLFLAALGIIPLLIYLNKRRMDFMPRGGNVFGCFFLFAILIYASFLSIMNQYYTGAISEYIIVMFSLASFFYIPFLPSLFIFIGSHLFFVYTLLHIHSHYLLLQDHVVNSTAALCLAFFISRLTYNQKMAAFINSKTIEEQMEALREISIKDGMTGLFNHNYICTQLEEEIRRTKRYKTPLSIGIFDLDGFKNVNDTHGHQEGDAILIYVAQQMRETFRDTDLIGRYGGDEFLVIFPETEVEDAVIAAERFRQVLTTPNSQGTYTSISVSGGIVKFNGEDTLEAFIHKADILLYNAKNLGKDQISW